jgi:hypothetical protein
LSVWEREGRSVTESPALPFEPDVLDTDPSDVSMLQ